MEISQYTAQNPAQALMASRIAALDAAQPVARKTDEETKAAQTADEPNSLFEMALDTVNPLQHIPGVNGIYREATGDGANALSSMAGGFLFGGPIGLAAGAAGSFLEMLTGKSLMGHAMALFSGADEGENGPLQSVQTAAAGGGEPLFSPTEGIGLKQYQSFASAAGSIHQGIGAQATDVGWSENLWTQQALKQATSQYESNQRLGGGDQERTNRIV